LRECIYCEIEFDPSLAAKKRAGGKINECPDCVVQLQLETAVKYLGHHPGDDNTGALSILTFRSDEDRASYTAACNESDKVKL
jgi:hypothetical protein